MGNFTELDMYLFGQATHYDIYKKCAGTQSKITPMPCLCR